MKESTAESLVDAYAWAVELSVMELPDAAKTKVDGLLDALRDFLTTQLSEKGAGDELRVL